MIGDRSRRGREEDSNMVKFHMTTAKDKKAEHHYWRVIVTYNDGETSGNRVFSAANAPNSKVGDATGRVGELGRATGPGFRKQ